MITIFTIPKPFRDYISIIQRNAIKSWLSLHHRCEVILFGDDEGTSDVAAEFGVRHIPEIERSDYGTPLLNSIFKNAQISASHDILAYVNADIILISDFMNAIQCMPEDSFLMTGQRFELDLKEQLDFNNIDCEKILKELVVKKGILQGRGAMDYFAFRKGLWRDMPPFAIGRTAWDNWLIYYARSRRVPVIDVTDVVTAIHQNHEYSHRPRHGFTWKGPEAERNLELAGDGSKFTLDNATLRLTSEGFKKPLLTANRFYRSIESIPLLKPSLSPLARLLLMILAPLVKIRRESKGL